jgi:flavin-dependent dehydrogenase
MFLTDYAIGYGWLSQRGDWINIGIGHPAWLLNSREERLLIWKRFSSDLKKAFNIGPGNSEILDKPRAYSYPAICGPTGLTYGDRVILVGDAAGFSLNFSGEGIGPAITTGGMAAAVLETAHGSDDFSAGILSRYEELWCDSMLESFKATYAFLKGYIYFDWLRRWFNRNALDFMDIFMKDPELDKHLRMVLSPDSNKDEAFMMVRWDIPKALFRLAKMKVR